MAATRIQTQDIAALAVTTAKLADASVTAAKLGILTTKGDLMSFSTLHARLGVGADNTVLTADSAQTLGVKWAAPSTLVAANFVQNEVPTGTVDGVNAAFVLANTPTTGTVAVYKNGIRQKVGSGNDYTIATNTVTFLAGNLPQTGDNIVVDYMK